VTGTADPAAPAAGDSPAPDPAAPAAGDSPAPDPASTRERILDAAVRLIAENGIEDVRIARIARIAGVSTSLVHYHFDGREALLTEALEHSFDTAASARVRSEPPDGGAQRGTAAEHFADMIEQSLAVSEVAQLEWKLWVELWLRAARDPQLRPIAARMYKRYRDWLAEGVAAGIDSGEFAACEPAEVADIAMALIDGIGLRVLLDDPSMPYARARDRIGSILARELGCEPAQLPFAINQDERAAAAATQ